MYVTAVPGLYRVYMCGVSCVCCNNAMLGTCAESVACAAAVPCGVRLGEMQLCKARRYILECCVRHSCADYIYTFLESFCKRRSCANYVYMYMMDFVFFAKTVPSL
jgi:hypothetical protein